MCIVIVVMAAVWPIGLWRRVDGGGAVKKECNVMLNTVFIENLDAVKHLKLRDLLISNSAFNWRGTQ
jgi:hypothetical protein